ncbi:MAG: hypothetical protein M3P04_05685 [Actinomycetota bacterium]|nr:hypothetical protein [Actinomycetota bacterium]
MFLRVFAVLAAFLAAATHTATPATTSPRVARPHVTQPHQAKAPTARRSAPVDGADVSWPNCATHLGIAGRHGYHLPMPRGNARFVVVGATNGPAFTPNPCLRSQVTWIKKRHLLVSAYAVVHFPTRAELRRFGGRGSSAERVEHVGAAEARHALASLRLAGLQPSMVWVDVETVGGHPWSSHRALNRSLIRGVSHELQRQHVSVGIYSYRTAWNKVTGGWRNSLPTWVPSGSPHRADALARCRQRSFSGGRVLMGQWTGRGRDFNLTCPGAVPQLAKIFRKT